MILKLLLGLILLCALSFGAFLIVGPEKLWHRMGSIGALQLVDWPGRSSPNWALACPKMSDGKRYCKGIPPTHESPVVAGKPADIYRWLVSRIEADGYASRKSGSSRTASSIQVLERDDAGFKIRFEALSPTLNFPDVIDLEVFAVGSGKTGFALLSQSVIGTGDFGLNARRIEKVLEDFTDIYDRN